MCESVGLPFTLEPNLPGTLDRPDLEVQIGMENVLIDVTVSNMTSKSYRSKSDEQVEKEKIGAKSKKYAAIAASMGCSFQVLQLKVLGGFGPNMGRFLVKLALATNVSTYQLKSFLQKTSLCATGRALKLLVLSSSRVSQKVTVVADSENATVAESSFQHSTDALAEFRRMAELGIQNRAC